MCSTRSNAFEASKNTACTDEPWVYSGLFAYLLITESLHAGWMHRPTPESIYDFNKQLQKS